MVPTSNQAELMYNSDCNEMVKLDMVKKSTVEIRFIP